MSWGLGLAHAAVGEQGAAIELMDAALASVSAHALHGLFNLIAVDLAEVLIGGGAQDDRTRAATLLQQARASAVDIGAGGVIERIDRLAS
ncbi:MAG: hypothetical protein ABR571_00755 [Jatrophihabitans sp.]|uniref:hypothetical protein n=1 Tax=Jatrophihabitans sp. TaxID=1932789 RepID=UPI00390DC107